MENRKFKRFKNIVDDKLEDLKRYVKVLYKENQELRELLYKTSLNEPIDFDGDNFKKEDIAHNEIHNSNIGKKFMEDAIDEMYEEDDDPFTGF